MRFGKGRRHDDQTGAIDGGEGRGIRFDRNADASEPGDESTARVIVVKDNVDTGDDIDRTTLRWRRKTS